MTTGSGVVISVHVHSLLRQTCVISIVIIIVVVIIIIINNVVFVIIVIAAAVTAVVFVFIGFVPIWSVVSFQVLDQASDGFTHSLGGGMSDGSKRSSASSGCQLFTVLVVKIVFVSVYCSVD